MKLKYIILGFCCFLFCSGCSVEYNLDIDNELNLKEKITINSQNSNDINRIKELKDYYPTNYSADRFEIFEKKTKGVSYYDVNKNSDNTSVEFKYNYNFKSFSDNVFAKTCYEYVTLMNYYNEETKRNELILSTSNKFMCFDYQDTLDNVTLKIHTKRKVYDNNADEVKNDTYIWNINRDNQNEKYIMLSMESTIKDNEVPFWEKNILLFVLLGLLLIGLIVFIIMSKRSKRVDKI